MAWIWRQQRPKSAMFLAVNSIYMELKKCNTKWRNLKAFLGVILSPFSRAVNYNIYIFLTFLQYFGAKLV